MFVEEVEGDSGDNLRCRGSKAHIEPVRLDRRGRSREKADGSGRGSLDLSRILDHEHRRDVRATGVRIAGDDPHAFEPRSSQKICRAPHDS